MLMRQEENNSAFQLFSSNSLFYSTQLLDRPLSLLPRSYPYPTSLFRSLIPSSLLCTVDGILSQVLDLDQLEYLSLIYKSRHGMSRPPIATS